MHYMQRKNNSSQLVTKDYLKKELEVVDENARKYRDQILAKLDETMGELGAMREENVIGSHQTSQLRSDVDNHEKRIKHLEKIQPTA